MKTETESGAACFVRTGRVFPWEQRESKERGTEMFMCLRWEPAQRPEH